METAKPSTVAFLEPSHADVVVRIHLRAARTVPGKELLVASVMSRIQNVMDVDKWNPSTGVRSVQTNWILQRA